MKAKWKRSWNNKNFNFEVEYLLNAKLNGDTLSLPKVYLEDQDLQDQIKSTLESYILDKIKKNEETKKENELNDEKTKVRNHFRNVCFRRKFNTIRDHIKYISEYYRLSEMKVMEYVEEDITIIKKQTLLK
jgi:hypothetical protein